MRRNETIAAALDELHRAIDAASAEYRLATGPPALALAAYYEAVTPAYAAADAEYREAITKARTDYALGLSGGKAE